jgi:hypothetical protein
LAPRADLDSAFPAYTEFRDYLEPITEQDIEDMPVKFEAWDQRAVVHYNRGIQEIYSRKKATSNYDLNELTDRHRERLGDLFSVIRHGSRLKFRFAPGVKDTLGL